MPRKIAIAGMTAVLAIAAPVLGGCAAAQDEDTLTFMFRGGPAEEEAYTAAIEQYEADTGIDVEIIMTTADEYATKLRAAIVGGQVPDVFYIDPGSVESYVNAGVIQDITEYVEASDAIDPAARQALIDVFHAYIK